jgi:hypothetical protein
MGAFPSMMEEANKDRHRQRAAIRPESTRAAPQHRPLVGDKAVSQSSTMPIVRNHNSAS